MATKVEDGYDAQMLEISSTSAVRAARSGPQASQAAAVVPRMIFAVGHALALGAGVWLLGGGNGESWRPSWLAASVLEERRVAVLAGCGAVLLLRSRFWVLGNGPRALSWSEAWWKLAVLSAYQVGLPFAALGTPEPLAGRWDASGLLLFVLGSGLSMGADLARSRAFSASGGTSGLCTTGPFTWVRHPSFLGDLGWGVGWAMLTRNPWTLLLPVACALHFAASTAMEEEQALERQDPAAFRRWASRTKRLVPFLY